MPDLTRQHITSARRLAVIMFTVIVVYTALMGKDSNKALEIDPIYDSANYELGLIYKLEKK